VGTDLPRSSVDWVASHLYFIHTAVLAYIILILLPHSKCATERICRIKSEKIPPTVECQPQSIPLNAMRKGHGLSWQCHIFKGRIASSPFAPDRVSFLGTRGFPWFRSGSSLRFAIGGCGINQGLSPHRYVLY